jgi:hypothetical protein
MLLLRLEKDDRSGFDDEEINHQVYPEAKETMEQSGLHKLATHKLMDSGLHLWKHKVGWGADGDTSWTNTYGCDQVVLF